MIPYCLNSARTIAKLKRVDPPPWRSAAIFDRLHKAARVETIWIDALSEQPYHLCGASPDPRIFFDHGYLISTATVEVYSYTHELCHAMVARLHRPRMWNRLPNYGCITDKEEVETCHLQFWIHAEWPETLGQEKFESLLVDFGFVGLDARAGERLARKVRLV